MGFSAGAELAAPAAVLFEEFDKKNSDAGDPFSGVSSRPDFVGIIYPGPTPFARNRTAPPIPRNVPPAFLAGGGSGDQGHAIWANDYFTAMLALGGTLVVQTLNRESLQRKILTPLLREKSVFRLFRCAELRDEMLAVGLGDVDFLHAYYPLPTTTISATPGLLARSLSTSFAVRGRRLA